MGSSLISLLCMALRAYVAFVRSYGIKRFYPKVLLRIAVYRVGKI